MNNNDVRNIFNSFRQALNESEEQNNQNGVPYTQQDDLLQTSTRAAKEQFGADFSKVDNAMYYFKDDGNVILTGHVPSLNDISFQFKYKDSSGNGCYIWTDGQMVLSDDNLRTLSRIYGVYKNWKQELSMSEDIKPMNLKTE